MTELNLVDLVRGGGIGEMPVDPVTGKEDWSKALQTAVQLRSKTGETPLIPNGFYDTKAKAPVYQVVRIPESLNAISSVQWYRDARYIWFKCDDGGAGFHFDTLGPGNVSAEASITRAIKDPSHCIELEAGPIGANGKRSGGYRGRFLMGGVGGHAIKYDGLLRGPKLPYMPWRSPSGPGSRNCLEGQHGFWGKDFGKQLSAAEIAAGMVGWDFSGSEICWIFGDALSPGTVKPNDVPNIGLLAAGFNFHHLGRMGMLMNGISHAHLTWGTFGEGIPSSILHAETGGGVNVMDHIMMDYCVIQSGAHTVHVSGEVVELDHFTVEHCTRRDQQHAVYIDMGPQITSGPRSGQFRGRNINVRSNAHDRWTSGLRLGYYQLCSDVHHTDNSGPVDRRFVVKDPKTGKEKLDLSSTLYGHGPMTRNVLSPNTYYYRKSDGTVVR